MDEKQAKKVRLKIREYRMRGEPMPAMRLQQALDADEMPDPALMQEAGGVKTDVPLVGNVDLTPPPRNGKGSGKKAWIKFAAKVTSVDKEVLERMGNRDDIIAMLEAKGNLPKKN